MIFRKRFARFLYFSSLIALTLFINQLAIAEPDDAEETEAVAAQPNWDPVVRLTNGSNSPNGADRPSIAAAPNGNKIIVAYMRLRSNSEEDADPYYRESTDNGKTWSAPQPIYSHANESRFVSVTYDSNNSAHAVWAENDNELWYGRKNNWPCDTSCRIFTVSGVGSLINSPVIVANGTTLHLIWSEVNPLAFDDNIYYARSTNNGNSWSGKTNISNTPGASQKPAMAIDSSGRVNVVWEDQNGDGSFSILYARRNTDGSWTTPRAISDRIGGLTSGREPDIYADGNTLHVAVEDRITSTQQRIFYLECSTGCANVSLSNWSVNAATVQNFGAKDLDPSFLLPKLTQVSGCTFIYFSGITGDVGANNEKVRSGDSCSNWSANPAVSTIEDALDSNDRAIKPSVAQQNNWWVYIAYIEKDSTRSDVYFVRNQPAIYLPFITK